MQARRTLAVIAVLLAVATAWLAAAALPARADAAPEPTPSPTPPHVVVPRVALRAPATCWLGDTLPVVVAVEPALPGAAVVLESGRGGVWSTETSATLDALSQAKMSWRPDAFGPLHLRAVLAAGAGHTAATSTTLRVIVNRPNRHHVPYKYAHYIVIVVHEYRLYYYEHGTVVRAFDVALGRPGYRTPLGTFHIYGKRKPAGGPLGSCAMFFRREGGIAIHGTDQPELLRRFPRPFSHGCARMHNAQALWLYARVPRGTTVRTIR